MKVAFGIGCVLVALALSLQGCGGGGDVKPSHDKGISLDAVTFAGGPRLLVTASPVSPSGSDMTPQKLLLDTGSSTLAFCDTSLASQLQDLQSTYVSCNAYGEPGNEEGYWGYFYNGDVHIANVANGDIHVKKAVYSVMQNQVKMPCGEGGAEGIFGIAFRQLDTAQSDAPTDWSPGSVGSCEGASTDFVQPLMQYLNSKGGVEQIGIYWNGQVSEGGGEGIMYLDDDATNNNPYFDQAKADAMGKAALTEGEWYQISAQTVQLSATGQSFDITCSPDDGMPCIMDTGNPSISVPSDVIDAIEQLSPDQLGDLVINLKGAAGADSVSLKLDMKSLTDNKWLSVSQGESVTLGLPIRAFYYSVHDITDASVSFTPLATSFAKAKVSEVRVAKPNATDAAVVV